MTATLHTVSGYINNIFSPKMQKAIANEANRIVLSQFQDADYIVVTGVSGIVIGSIVAHLSGKRLVVVRKEDEKSHADHRIEGFPVNTRMSFVILDDFVDSGATLNRIAEVLRAKSKVAHTTLNCCGYLMYGQGFRTADRRLPFKDKKFQFFCTEDLD